jgi:hypothetical protein
MVEIAGCMEVLQDMNEDLWRELRHGRGGDDGTVWQVVMARSPLSGGDYGETLTSKKQRFVYIVIFIL